ncbi:MAG: hypothetical protein J6R47_01880 [Acholeplasmatales bacterium]|nr:hypothetical protein [Acholeplasmatales bacterium]
MEKLTLYEVYGEDTGRYPVHRGTFINLKDACRYAVANSGKIAYRLPEVFCVTWEYDRENQKMTSQRNRIESSQIYYMNSI